MEIERQNAFLCRGDIDAMADMYFARSYDVEQYLSVNMV
jgi:hypothetical protein